MSLKEFIRGRDPKEVLEIGLDSKILKFCRQSGKDLSCNFKTRENTFYTFFHIAYEAAHRQEGPIQEYMKMLLHILTKYSYEDLARGHRGHPEQRHINEAGGFILTVFLNYQDVPEVQEVFRKTVKTIRLTKLSPGQKSKLLRFFRDEYVKNLPDEV